ncbi:hypothetical protein VNO77_50009 [Canavalia gladiata]|uniref:Uncharacterized protein n=1 Tax=Canavalia gladiata TaxID=3824 RepID=A0AAN9PFI3_CANGL
MYLNTEPFLKELIARRSLSSCRLISSDRKGCSYSWEGAASIALAVKTLGLGASVSSVHPRSAGQITTRGGSSYNSSGTSRGGCSQSIPWCASIRGEKVSGLETLAFAGKFSALFLSSHQGFAPEVESKGWSSSRKEAGMGVSSFKTERYRNIVKSKNKTVNLNVPHAHGSLHSSEDKIRRKAYRGVQTGAQIA